MGKMQQTLEKIKQKSFNEGYEAAMTKRNTFIENNMSDDDSHFFLSGALAAITGQLSGHVESMKNDSLTSLDKKYFAGMIEELTNELKEVREWLVDNDYSVLDIDKKS